MSTPSPKRVSGFLRHGVVLSATWLLVFPVVYEVVLGGFYAHPKISYAMRALYTWRDGETDRTTDGLDFTPIIPEFSLTRFVLFWLLPLLLGWLFLYVVPRFIRWVAEGFRHA